MQISVLEEESLLYLKMGPHWELYMVAEEHIENFSLREVRQILR